MPRKTDIRKLKEEQFLRAALVQVEKLLRYDITSHYSVPQLADMGMIRKRWIRAACIASDRVKAVRHKGKTHFQYDGTPPHTNPYAQGINPKKLKSKKRKK